ncbi:MAG: vanadium-dependent haloperoxidase, partial [Saprospiraceae bacterium]
MRLFQLTTRFLMAATAGLVIFTSCVKNEITNDSFTKVAELKNLDSKLAVSWIQLSFELTRKTPGFSSPVAARTYAYLGLGMFEALVPGMPAYGTMQNKFQGFNKGTMKNPNSYGEISWAASLNETMYQLCKQFYANSTPEALTEVDKLYTKTLNELSITINQEILDNSKKYGSDQAEAIIKYADSDNQSGAFLNNYPVNYKGPQGEGLWSPSVHSNKRPLQPYWGDVRTFAKHGIDEMKMIAPPEFSEDKTSVFYSYALEVRNRTDNLNRFDEDLVNYWNEDIEANITPAGHMLSILCQNLLSENKDLGFAVFAFMKLSTAMHDATIAAWKTKYTYYTMRPETYIREFIDAEFLSLSNATATPEYSSGQAAVASAAAEILGNLFGYNYGFTDVTYEYRKDINGSPRAYTSFQDMAEEVLNSNLLGGIHYRFSLEAGQKQGIEI